MFCLPISSEDPAAEITPSPPPPPLHPDYYPYPSVGFQELLNHSAAAGFLGCSLLSHSILSIGFLGEKEKQVKFESSLASLARSFACSGAPYKYVVDFYIITIMSRLNQIIKIGSLAIFTSQFNSPSPPPPLIAKN